MNNILSDLENVKLPYLSTAFAKFLNEQSGNNADPVVLLAAAFVNYELSRGEVYLDLKDFFNNQKDEFNEIDIKPFKSYFKDWEKAFSNSVVISDEEKDAKKEEEKEGNSPLFWDKTHNRLYLRRYWTYQKTVDDMIYLRLAQVRDKLPDEIAEQLELLFKLNWRKITRELLEKELGQNVICSDIANKLSFPNENSKIEPDWEKITSEMQEQLNANLQNLDSKKITDKLRPFFVETDWQKIACAVALRSNFSIITGGPGTGKTTTVTKLLILLVSLMQSEKKDKNFKPKILLAAPTGKAANRVSESINDALTHLKGISDEIDKIQPLIPTKASTLHRLLGARPDTRLYKQNKNNQLNADIVIIDEASMIDLEMMAALLEALPDQAQLILLGDKNQLSSVEPGSVFGNLCFAPKSICYNDETLDWIKKYADEDLKRGVTEKSPINQQTTMLRHSYRFDKKSGIKKLANIFLEAKKLEDATKELKTALFNKYDDLNKITNFKQLEKVSTDGYSFYKTEIKKRASYSNDDEWAVKVLDAFDKFRILCAIHESEFGTDAINKKVQEWLFPKQEKIWFEGRPVMITKNDYSLKLMNGDIGIALKINYKSEELKVAFLNTDDSPQKIRWFSTSRISDAQTAFALTVHKSQGSEFEHTLLVLPNDDVKAKVLTKELYYTAITRAKSKFTLLQQRKSTTTTGE
jgi:exodeoxyribonuclease V alpha subunit